MRKIIVFVYGTLLRGQSNHRLLAEATFLGETLTRPEFDLVDLGAFPAMLEGGQTAVMGEIYAIEQKTLARLDELEGHPRFYRRIKIRLPEGQEVETYILARNRIEQKQYIHSGDWIKYQKEKSLQ